MTLNKKVSQTQIILFLFAIVFIILGAIGKSPKLTYSLGGALVILAAIGPESIKEFSLKILGLKITRHEETPEVTEEILELITTESDQPIADDPLVKAAESRSSEEKAATDYLLLARTSYDEKKYDEGIGFAHQGVSLNPNTEVRSGLENGLGLLHHELGNYGDAASYYRMAIATNPMNPKPRLNLGNLLKNGGQFDEAEVAYRKVIKIDPEYAKAHYNMGNLFAGQGRYDESEVAYRKAIELDSNFASAHFNLSLLLTELGQEEEAEAEYQIAIKLDPSLADEE